MADKISFLTYALAKSYTAKSLLGGGAVRGKPCQIKSIEDVAGGKKITFIWYLDGGSTQESSTIIKDGIGIKDAYIDASDNLVLVRDDDAEIVVGTLPSGYDGAVVYKVDSLPTTGIDDTALYIYDGVIYEYDTPNGKWVEVLSGGSGGTEYVWEINGSKLEVTDSSTGIKQSLQLPTSSAGGIVNDLPVGLDVGGIKKPKTYVAGTEVETILNDLLNPVTPPTISNPKATLSCNKSVFIYGIDESIGSVQFTLNFERGTISSGGHTVGEATGYTIDGQSGRVVVVDLDAKATNKITITGNVAYGQGDQAYNSDGTPYGTPRPASSINSNSITFEKKPYIYTTKSGAFARMPIAQYNSSPLQIALPNGDDVSSPICKIGLPSRATELLVKNELTGQYVDCSSEFDESTEQIDGRTYYIYKDNRGSRSGDRDFKFSF